MTHRSDQTGVSDETVMSDQNVQIPVYSHGRPTVRGTRGMVSSAHPLASMAGIAMLRQGGNAFDAIAAAAAALNVVEPFMSGLAGLGMATVRTAADGRMRCLSFHPPVPREFDAASLSKEDTATGANASGVPGSLAGWCFLVRELGVLTLPQVFAPAIEYAREGVATSPFYRAMSQTGLSRDMQPEWREVYLDSTSGGEPDKVLKQPDLARTLSAIADEGPGYLYDGPLGEKMATHLRGLGGCIGRDDLAAVQPVWEEPLSAAFGRLDVHVPPPPEDSFQFLITLRILQKVGFAGIDHLSADHMDRIIRAVRLAAECRIQNARCSVDRAEELLDDVAIDRLATLLDQPEAAFGRTENYGQGPLTDIRALREHTTSLSATDRDGNAVCLTQSLGSPFGSGVVIPDTGICMNNFLYWGDLDPESQNYLAGGQRFGTCLAPSISLADGEFALALGTPGSYGILQTQAQAMVHREIYGLDLQAAIDAPRARVWDGTRVDLESRFEPSVAEALCDRGHDVGLIEPFSMTCGGMHAISRDRQTGVLGGAADSRREGAAMAF